MIDWLSYVCRRCCGTVCSGWRWIAAVNWRHMDARTTSDSGRSLQTGCCTWNRTLSAAEDTVLATPELHRTAPYSTAALNVTTTHRNKSPAVPRVSRPYSRCTLATCVHNCCNAFYEENVLNTFINANKRWSFLFGVATSWLNPSLHDTVFSYIYQICIYFCLQLSVCDNFTKTD